jgi:glycosyltransferase involved in cell wall biosynthesis
MIGASKIKITHIINGLHTGGAEMMLYKLLSRMNRVQFDAQVVALIEGGEVRRKIEDLGIAVKSLEIPRNAPTLAGLYRLIRHLRQISPDIVQTWMYQSDLAGGIMSRMFTNAPVIWNIRCSYPDWSGRGTLRVANACASLSKFIPARIICGSVSSLNDHIAMGYKKEKMLVIPNGFDLDHFHPSPETGFAIREELGVSPETKLVGMFARFAFVKDPENFVRAAAILQDRMPDVHFVMCGHENTWSHGQLVKWIEQANVRTKFHLLGPRQDVPRYMAAMNLVVLSSQSEGFPNVLGEAMACGVPCAATDAGDSALIIGDTGKIVPIKNPVALAAACEELLRLSREERQKLGMAARQRIAEHFSLPMITQKYEQLYSQLLFA